MDKNKRPNKDNNEIWTEFGGLLVPFQINLRIKTFFYYHIIYHFITFKLHYT